MRLIPCCVLIVHIAAGVAHTQTVDHLQIELGAYTVTDNGGEKPVGVWWSTGPLTLGKSGKSTFSVGETCGSFAVSSAGELTDNATTAWSIEVTPLRVVRDTVTFRLRWVRLAGLRQQLDQIPINDSKSFRMPNEDIELTLRPGESWPVDSAKVAAGAKTIDGRTCRGNSAVIRARVDHYPPEVDDRRLMAADLWLVERLANGSDAPRGEVSTRGLPHRPFRFYFDSLVDANVSLEISGILRARPESGALSVSVETRARWDETNRGNFIGPQRYVDSVVQMKPGEVVEIPLPKFGDTAGPFAKRQFALRIRARLC